MSAVGFREPISIFMGLGFPVEVPNVWEAHRILAEWSGSRDDNYFNALLKCRQAINDETRVEQARLAFEAFATSRGVLAGAAIQAAARRYAQEWAA